MANMAIQQEQLLSASDRNSLLSTSRDQLSAEQQQRIEEIKGLAKKFWCDRLEGDFRSITGKPLPRSACITELARVLQASVALGEKSFVHHGAVIRMFHLFKTFELS